MDRRPHEDPEAKLPQEELEQIEEIRSHVIDAIAETMDLYGVARSVGRLYAIMYFQEKPLTLDEMREELGMSKGSMSIGVRKLMENKMVHRVFRKGERKDLYKAETDFFKSFIAFFCHKWERELSVNEAAIDLSEKEYQRLLAEGRVSEETKELIRMDLEKLQQSREYYRFLERLIGKLRSGELIEWIMEKEKEEEE